MKLLIIKKYLFQLNTLLFIGITYCKLTYNIDIFSWVIWIASLFFISSIILELKSNIKNKDILNILGYQIKGVGRIFLGLTLVLLLKEDVLKENISFIIFYFNYLAYLFFGIRVKKIKKST